MICKENDSNFILTNSFIPELMKFIKIDSINNYEYYKSRCIENNIYKTPLIRALLSYLSLCKQFLFL